MNYFNNKFEVNAQLIDFTQHNENNEWIKHILRMKREPLNEPIEESDTKTIINQKYPNKKSK